MRAAPQRLQGSNPPQAVRRVLEGLDPGAGASVERTCEHVLEATAEVLAADRSAIMLLDDGRVMRVKAARGLSGSMREALEGYVPWPPDLQNPRPVTVADGQADEPTAGLRPALEQEGIHTLTFVPMMLRGRLTGSVLLCRDRPQPHADEELLVAGVVAAQAAFALEARRLEDELLLAGRQLEVVLDALADPVTVQRPDGELLWANTAAAHILGFGSAAELLAAPVATVMDRFEVLDEHGDPIPPGQFPGRLALEGQEPEERLMRYRVRSTGEERLSAVRARPVFDESGRVRFAVNVFRDVTEQERAVEALRRSEERFAFLASTTPGLLDAAVDYHRILERVADLIVPDLADWCSIRELRADGTIHRVLSRHADPSKAELAARLSAYPDQPSPQIVEVARTGRAVLTADIPADALETIAVDEGHLELLRSLGLRSAMVLPLRARGRTLGVLTMATAESGRRYGESELELAQDLARRAAMAIDNARLYEEQRKAHAGAEAARSNLRLLLETSTLLAASLDYEQGLQRLARLAASALCDLCIVDVAQPDRSIRRVAAVTADPSKQELADLLAARYAPDPAGSHPAVGVMRTGRPTFATEMSEEFLRRTTRDEEHLRICLELGFLSYMSLPLAARGKVLGTLTLVTTTYSGRRYSQADVQLGEDLARRAALVLDNARLFEERTGVARILQQSLLPPQLPRIPGVDVAARYLPAGSEVGGDFYDLFQTGPEQWVVAIGDVCGKGVEAAALTGMIRYTLRGVAMQEQEPGAMLSALNEAILPQVTDYRFCTVLAVTLDVSGQVPRARVASGGHPLPFVLRREGRVEQMGREGTVLGIFPDVRPGSVETELKPGDALLLYTDGAIHERAPDDVSAEDRIVEVLAASAGERADGIAWRVERAVAENRRHAPRDDAAIVVLRIQ